jgi:citrate lyase subunit beta / citryl-CoA lyase
MPAANARALAKASQLPADALILDLEDAVAPAAKEEARSRACEVASAAYGERVVAIRVNGIGTQWHEADVQAVARARPAAVVMPKVRSGEELRAFERSLDAAGAPDDVSVWAMLETASGVLHAGDIAAAGERLAVLVIGTNDLVAELRVLSVPNREPLISALSMVVLAARASGRLILDGVYNDVRELRGFEEECEQGRRLGFDGKTLIHPDQIAICNRVFSPTKAEMEHARRVIGAFENATRAGAGVGTLDGKLIESLHVAQARRVLALGGVPTDLQ